MNHIESLKPGSMFYLSSQSIFSVGEMTHASSQMQEPRKPHNGYNSRQRALTELGEYALSTCFPSATSPISFHLSTAPLLGNNISRRR